MDRVVIAGAGHAGGSVAAFLRQYRFEGEIVLVGDEPLPPYQRPPLSKAWLKGEADSDSLMLKAPAWYSERHIELRLGSAVTGIDRAARTVRLSDGAELAYSHLVVATGARARKLPIPGADMAGVLELRTLGDAEALKRSLGPGRRLAIIGGGYVGLEAAATARELGAEAIVIERESRCLARVACEPLSTFFQTYHRSRGVVFELGAEVTALEGPGQRLTGVRLADGRVVDCDAVLVGVGAVPNDAIARQAGLECADGVVVDADARTSDAAVFAVGDVTRRPSPGGQSVRLESVPNALEQARQAACAIAGRQGPAPETPWFWSDQYDLKLQIAGLALDANQVVVRGDPASAQFAVFHLRNQVLRAVEAVNAPAEFMAGRQLISNRRPLALSRLANPTVSMKDVAA